MIGKKCLVDFHYRLLAFHGARFYSLLGVRLWGLSLPASPIGAWQPYVPIKFFMKNNNLKKH
ncbi:hypothetical protein CN925_00740 [Bacillus sp. AFS055030]|nr:hypothetical protein CN925_00740 [Bacillus sp. AFS055030]